MYSRPYPFSRRQRSRTADRADSAGKVEQNHSEPLPSRRPGRFPQASERQRRRELQDRATPSGIHVQARREQAEAEGKGKRIRQQRDLRLRAFSYLHSMRLKKQRTRIRKPSDPSTADIGGLRTFLIDRRGDEIIRERENDSCRMRRDFYRLYGPLAQSSPHIRASSLAKRLCKSERCVSLYGSTTEPGQGTHSSANSRTETKQHPRGRCEYKRDTTCEERSPLLRAIIVVWANRSVLSFSRFARPWRADLITHSVVHLCIRETNVGKWKSVHAVTHAVWGKTGTHGW